MPSLNELLARQAPQDHLVQFYGEVRELVPNVAAFLREGWWRGDWMIVIATPSNRQQFADALAAEGVSADVLQGSGRLTVLDAESILSQFMVSGRPDWERFDAVVGDLVRQSKARAGNCGLRAYGEMVDLLWKSGQLEAAAKLEEFWNRLLESAQFSLYCAYTVHHLFDGAPDASLREMLRTHSHLLPVRTNGELSRSVDRALVEVLGEASSQALRPLIRASRLSSASLPSSEATVLWLRIHLPACADTVLNRARAYYQEECDWTSSEGSGSR